MTEGELKKRIERAHQELAFFPQANRDYFQEIIDEAKQDLAPQLCNLNGLGYTHVVVRRDKWEKWFGEQTCRLEEQ